MVITGASTGIGEELAYQYARLGANIIITARREQRLKEVDLLLTFDFGLVGNCGLLFTSKFVAILNTRVILYDKCELV